MEMTIEKHIEQLKKLKSFHNGSYGASINFAIDTMRKYQRVQEIIKSEMSYASPNMNPNNLSGLSRALEIFREVEDGNEKIV